MFKLCIFPRNREVADMTHVILPPQEQELLKLHVNQSFCSRIIPLEVSGKMITLR